MVLDVQSLTGRDSLPHREAAQNVFNDARTWCRQFPSADKEPEMATYLLLIPISASVLSENVHELRETHTRELRVYCELWDGTSVEGPFSNKDQILQLHTKSASGCRYDTRWAVPQYRRIRMLCCRANRRSLTDSVLKNEADQSHLSKGCGR